MTSLQNGNYNTRSMNGLTSIYANDITADTIAVIDGNVSNDLTVGNNVSIGNSMTIDGTINANSDISIWDKGTPTPYYYKLTTSSDRHLKLTYRNQNNITYELFDCSFNVSNVSELHFKRPVFLNNATYLTSNMFVDDTRRIYFGDLTGAVSGSIRYDTSTKYLSIESGAISSNIYLTTRDAGGTAVNVDITPTLVSIPQDQNTLGVMKVGNGAAVAGGGVANRTFNVVSSEGGIKLARGSATAGSFIEMDSVSADFQTINNRVFLGAGIPGDERFRVMFRLGAGDYETFITRRTGTSINTPLTLTANYDLTFTTGGTGKIVQTGCTGVNALSDTNTGVFQATSSGAAGASLTGAFIHSGSSNNFQFVLNPGAGTYNGLVQAGDILMVGLGGSQNTRNIVLGTWNSNNCGIRLTSSTVRIGGALTTDAITQNANNNLTQSGTGIISQAGSGTNQLKDTNISGTLTATTFSPSSITCNTLTVNTSVQLNTTTAIAQNVSTQTNTLAKTTISTANAAAGITNTLQVLDNTNNKGLQFQPHCSAAGLNPSVQAGDAVISAGTSQNNQALNLTIWGTTGAGVRIAPNGRTTITYGDGTTANSSANPQTVSDLEILTDLEGAQGTTRIWKSQSYPFNDVDFGAGFVGLLQNRVYFVAIKLIAGERINGITLFANGAYSFTVGLYTAVSGAARVVVSNATTTTANRITNILFTASHTPTTTQTYYVGLVSTTASPALWGSPTRNQLNFNYPTFPTGRCAGRICLANTITTLPQPISGSQTFAGVGNMLWIAAFTSVP